MYYGIFIKHPVIQIIGAKGSWSDLLILLWDDAAVNRPPITPEAPGEPLEGDLDQELTFFDTDLSVNPLFPVFNKLKIVAFFLTEQDNPSILATGNTTSQMNAPEQVTGRQ